MGSESERNFMLEYVVNEINIMYCILLAKCRPSLLLF